MRLIAFATLITLAICHPNDRDRRQLPFGGGGGGRGGGGFGQLFNAPQTVLNTASKTASLGGAAFKIPGISDFTNTALDLSSIPAGNTDALFDGFQSQLKRTYATAEETLLRKNIFKGTNDFVQGFNSAAAGFTVALNWLADLTLEEFNKLLNGYGKSKSGGDKFKSKAKPFDLPTSPQALPKSVDWRKEGAVTPIKNQQQCASCFAFSAIGAVEGHYFRKTGELLELSQQNLIDCTQDDEYQNLGCSGGFVDASFEYVKKNLGVNKYSDYPYESESGTCRFVKEKASANVTGFGTIPSGDEKALAAAVAKKGPVSVAIYASLLSFKQYKDGVYFDKECKNTSDDVNHAVLVVGYGEEDGKKYWIVKNSYGPDWGDKGYIKIAKDKGNHCGIATAAFYPVV